MLNIIYKSVDWSMRQAEQSHCFFTKGTALPPPPPTVAMEMPPNTEPRKCREGREWLGALLPTFRSNAQPGTNTHSMIQMSEVDIYKHTY